MAKIFNKNLIVSGVILFFTLLYFLPTDSSIPFYFTFSHPELIERAVIKNPLIISIMFSLGILIPLELYLFYVFIYHRKDSWFFINVVILIFLITFIWYGRFNDLAMRTTAPFLLFCNIILVSLLFKNYVKIIHKVVIILLIALSISHHLYAYNFSEIAQNSWTPITKEEPALIEALTKQAYQLKEKTYQNQKKSLESGDKHLLPFVDAVEDLPVLLNQYQLKEPPFYWNWFFRTE